MIYGEQNKTATVYIALQQFLLLLNGFVCCPYKGKTYVFYFNVCILALLISTVIIRYAAPTVKEWAHNHEVSSLSGAGDSLGNDVGDGYDANPEHAQATQ